MLLDILVICSLISTSPYYDCSEHWEIQVYSEPVSCFNGVNYAPAAGCTNFDTNTIKIYSWAMYNYERDPIYGYTVLEHELEHLKCKCDFHNGKDTY